MRTGKVVGWLQEKDCFVDKSRVKKDSVKPKEMEEVKSTKKCKVCGRELPLDQFGKNVKSRDGHLGVCHECKSEAARKKREQKDAEKDDAGPADIMEPQDITLDRLNDAFSLADYPDEALVDALKQRGYTGTITKVISFY